MVGLKDHARGTPLHVWTAGCGNASAAQAIVMIKSLLHHYSWPSPLQIHVMADEASGTTLAEFLASVCGGAWLRCKLHTRAMVFQTVAQLMPASASALLQRSALDFSTLVKVALPHVLPAE